MPKCAVSILAEMAFDTSFDGYGEDALPLEPDLLAWQDGISWADHILIVHPYWWGAHADPGQGCS